MKVLVLTPFYYIKDREELFHDTSCVHYLLKYWPKDTEIYVFNEYHAWAKQWPRYLSKEERKYLKEGYFFQEDGIKVNLIEIPIFPKQKRLLSFQKNKMSSFVNNYLRENKIIPDVAIFHQPSYYSIQYIDKLNLKCKKIAILHYSDILEDKRNSSFSKQLKKFNYIFTRSKNIKDYFVSKKINNIQEDIIFSGAPTHNQYIKRNFSTKKFNILYVGKLIKRKNADLLLKAIKKIDLNKINKVTIIGEGPEEKKYKKLCKKLKLENYVEFIPKVKREKILEYMDNSEIFVMPSVGETVGLVYLEAMSRGCLTIATRKEGIDGIIINEKNGYLVEPNSIESIAKTINGIFSSNVARLKSISDNALKSSKKFSEENVGIKYYELVKNIVNGEKDNEQV
ncbi:MAG: glycosyltransferase family 4 protein [Candidatus Coprovivens sp.]